MNTAVVVFVAGVAVAAIGHVLVKKGAMRSRHRPIFVATFDPLVLVGYTCMLGSTVASIVALRNLPLHMTVSLMPLGYLLVILLSGTVLGERIHRRQVWGMLVVFAGIWLFNLGS